MKKGGYIDDQIFGGTKEECLKIRGKCSVVDRKYFYDGTISKILSQVGMRPKVSPQ